VSNKLLENKITQIATLYYLQNISQKEISEKFNLSKMTVSRIIDKAKKLNIAHVDVMLPFRLNKVFGDKLRKKYDLKKVIIIETDNNQKEIAELIGRVWAFYMGISILDNQNIGIGYGKTISFVVNYLTPMETDNTHIIQLMGGPTIVSKDNPFTIVQETCRKLHAKGTYITSLALVENKKMRDLIINSNSINKNLWEKCDQAIFGIGIFKKDSILSPELISNQEFAELKKLEVVGNILGHCLNKKGVFLNTALEDRLVSIPVEILKKIKDRILIAGGEQKFQSIASALLSGIVTTLVTDVKIAKKLLL
jgi:DNA-binding transcriptional regulator LsrR (DeoR family)